MPRLLNYLLAATAATTVSVASMSPSFAYQCKNSPHQAVGVRPLKAAAAITARKNWSSSAKSQFGLSWSVWDIATQKSNTCVKLNTGKWRCLASAKPCNYVVP